MCSSKQTLGVFILEVLFFFVFYPGKPHNYVLANVHLNASMFPSTSENIVVGHQLNC